jgi:hypothetical protein
MKVTGKRLRRPLSGGYIDQPDAAVSKSAAVTGKSTLCLNKDRCRDE